MDGIKTTPNQKGTVITDNLKVTRTSSSLRPPLLESIGFARGPSLATIKKNEGEATRALLMVPPYTRMSREVFESPTGKIEEMKRAGAPIGLLRVGTAAQKAGYEVKIIDAAREGFDNEKVLVPEIGLYRYGLDDTEIQKRIKEYNPHAIGITLDYTCQWGNVKALVDLIKRASPHTVVVLGGAHVTADYKNALLDSAADYIVIGEGDRTFVELLKALENEEDVQNVKGIAYRGYENRPSTEKIRLAPRQGGIVPARCVEKGATGLAPGIVVTERRPFVPNISDFGVLNYDLVDLNLYSGPMHSGGKRKRDYGKCTYLFTSVGCNTRCGFCTIPIVNGPFRTLDASALDNQLKHLVERGVTEVLIEDDNLLHDPFWTLTVCKLLKKHNIAWMEEGGVALYALVAMHLGERAKEVLGAEYDKPVFSKIKKAIEEGITAEQIIKAMADAGCYSVYLAIESANEASLDASGKPRADAKAEITLEVVKLFEKYGINVTGGFMLGFAAPDEKGGVYSEKREDIMRTIAYARMLVTEGGMDFANPFIVTPLPGTPMGEYQMQFVGRPYDYFSHELGVMDLPGSLTAKQMELLRVQMLVKANGVEKMQQILDTKTWPV